MRFEVSKKHRTKQKQHRNWPLKKEGRNGPFINKDRKGRRRTSWAFASLATRNCVFVERVAAGTSNGASLAVLTLALNDGTTNALGER